MRATLPAPRELPAERHRQIRERLVRTVERGSRTHRRWHRPALMATAAAAALALVVGMISWQLGFGDGPGLRRAEPGGKSILAGMSPALREEFERGCVASAFSVPGEPEHPYRRGEFVLRNMIEDDLGQLAVLYGTEGGLVCQVQPKDPEYSAGYMGHGAPKPLTTPLAVDAREAAENPAMEYAAGRVSNQIARVAYVGGGRVTEALVSEGTFLVRVVHQAGWRMPERYPREVRAYDADGNLLERKQISE